VVRQEHVLQTIGLGRGLASEGNRSQERVTDGNQAKVQRLHRSELRRLCGRAGWRHLATPILQSLLPALPPRLRTGLSPAPRSLKQKWKKRRSPPREPRRRPTPCPQRMTCGRCQWLVTSFPYGIAYAAGSLSCTLPIFLVVVGTSLAGEGALPASFSELFKTNFIERSHISLIPMVQ
jgi:hypothetical protein